MGLLIMWQNVNMPFLPIVDALVKVYNSFLAPKIDDYNSSVYYENPSYLFESYRENKML